MLCAYACVENLDVWYAHVPPTHTSRTDGDGDGGMELGAALEDMLVGSDDASDDMDESSGQQSDDEEEDDDVSASSEDMEVCVCALWQCMHPVGKCVCVCVCVLVVVSWWMMRRAMMCFWCIGSRWSRRRL